MGDPLSDPRAQHLLAADTGEIAALATGFHRVATQAQTAAAGLRGAQHDATWTGAAADAFRAQVGKLPGDLDKVQHSYGEVATALDGYEAGLGPIQTQFRSLATQLNGARSSLSTAQGQLSTARTTLTQATAAPHAKPTTPAVVNAHTAVSSAAGTVGRISGEVSGLETRGYRLLDEFDTIRGHARSTVSGAAGIAPSESWLSGALHAIGNFVEGVATGIGKSVWDLVSGKAIINFIEHPSWATFGELAKDVAVTASLVAMVAAPFAAPELAEADAAVVGADAAAEGAAEGAAAGAGDASASTFGTAMRTVSSGANDVVTGAGGAAAYADVKQGKWAAAALDVVFIAGPNIGHMPGSIGDVKTFGDQFSNVLHIGDRQAEAAGESLAGLKDFKAWQDAGLNPVAARQISFRDGEFPASAKTFDLASPAGLDAAIASARSAATKAAGTALHLGRPVAIGFDNVIGDPSKEAMTKRLSPEPACG